MIRNLIILVTVLLICDLPSLDGKRHHRKKRIRYQRKPRLNKDEMQLMNKRLQKFTFDIYRHISHDNSSVGNMVFSPISIYSALSLLSRGARNTTLREIRSALHFPISYHVQRYTTKTCRKNSLYTLALAQRVYVDKSSLLKSGFKNFLNVTGAPEVKKLDFRGNPQHSRDKMNKWVAHKTMDQIPQLLADDQVTSMTRLYIVNALALEAKWLKPFTQSRGIFKMKRRQIKAKMLRASSTKCIFTNTAKRRGVGEWLKDTTMLVLPFQGDKLTYIAVMPNKAGNFAELDDDPEGQNKLEFMMQQIWNHTSDDGSLNYQQCQVTMPSFQLAYNYQRLKSTLQDMGISAMFDAHQADFSRIYRRGEKMFVTDVAHKATFALNKYGVKATAATAFGLTRRRRMPSVSINKPFIFFVRNQDTGALLFMGRVVNPLKS